jgi:two-component system, OmpR family, sensor histidine kinase VicK
MEKSYEELHAEIKRLELNNQQLYQHCEELKAELSARIRVEEQFNESQQRFSTIFHQSNVAHKIINRKLEIIEINHALADMLGYGEAEILGTKIMDYTHRDFKDYWHQLQTALWQEQVDHFDLEACLIKRDGSEVWVIVHTLLFEDQGEKFGYTLLEDVTGRKQLERHKDEFINVISHELKTPMTALKAQCQLMVRPLRKYEDGHADKMMAGIDKQSNRLTRLINNLVLVSKVESSKLHPEIEDYRLDELVSDVVSEIRLSSPQREITLDTTNSLPLKGDPDKIYQVIYNLLTNAIKFSGADTTVDISVKQQQEWAVVCIQDHGQGIPKESLEKVFERFYKVETFSSAVESGMGLGLYISSEIIRHQNGRLWVNSEPGKGSTFCFSLPILEV